MKFQFHYHQQQRQLLRRRRRRRCRQSFQKENRTNCFHLFLFLMRMISDTEREGGVEGGNKIKVSLVVIIRSRTMSRLL